MQKRPKNGLLEQIEYKWYARYHRDNDIVEVEFYSVEDEAMTTAKNEMAEKLEDLGVFIEGYDIEDIDVVEIKKL